MLIAEKKYEVQNFVVCMEIDTTLNDTYTTDTDKSILYLNIPYTTIILTLKVELFPLSELVYVCIMLKTK